MKKQMSKVTFPVLCKDELYQTNVVFVDGYFDGINLYYRASTRLWFAIIPETGLSFRSGKTLTEVSNDPTRPKELADFIEANPPKLRKHCEWFALKVAALETSKGHIKTNAQRRCNYE